MNVSSIITVGYEDIPPIRAPKKQSQIPKRQKPMQPSLPQRIMKKPRFRVPAKQTQYKSKQTQFQMQNYSKKALKLTKRIFFQNISKLLRIYLHYSAYSDILLHIIKGITLCS